MHDRPTEDPKEKSNPPKKSKKPKGKRGLSQWIKGKDVRKFIGKAFTDAIEWIFENIDPPDMT